MKKSINIIKQTAIAGVKIGCAWYAAYILGQFAGITFADLILNNHEK